MRNWQIIIAAGFIALLSAFGGYQLQHNMKSGEVVEVTLTEKQITPEQLIGTQVKEFTLFDVNGVNRRFSEWQGKVVVINFWATWCPPCRDEIPHFVELQHDYSDKGLQFVGIALQEADEIRDFLLEFNMDYPSLVGGGDVIKLAKEMGNDIGALPYTVIVDRDGLIAFTKRGSLSKPEAESVIQTLLYTRDT